MSDPQFDAFTARVADRYAIGEEIGRGSQATVYRTRDVASGATVAVKVFHTDLAFPAAEARAWGAALTLVLLTFLLTFVARVITARFALKR